jgi:hypothetical protein
VLEVKSPLNLSFIGNEQPGTGFTKGKFQRSFAAIPDKAATYVSTALREKQAAEVPENGAT